MGHNFVNRVLSVQFCGYVKKLKIISIFIFFFLFYPQPAMPNALNDADEVVKKAIKTIVELMNDKETSSKEKSARIREIVDDVFDFDLIAKLTLGRENWKNFSQSEQQEFVTLFSSQLKNTYYRKMDFFSDEKIFYEKPKKIKNNIHILTWVFLWDKKISILYKLYDAQGNWKMYDAEINGVSIILSYRAQYREFLANGSISDFLNKMRHQNSPL